MLNRTKSVIGLVVLALSQYMQAAAVKPIKANSVVPKSRIKNGSTVGNRGVLAASSENVPPQSHNNVPSAYTGGAGYKATAASLRQELATLKATYARQQKEKDVQLLALRKQLAAEQQKNVELTQQLEPLKPKMSLLNQINMDEIRPTEFTVTMPSDYGVYREESFKYCLPMNDKTREAIGRFTESIRRYQSKNSVLRHENGRLREDMVTVYNKHKQARMDVAQFNNQLRKDNARLKEQVRIGYEEWRKKQVGGYFVC